MFYNLSSFTADKRKNKFGNSVPACISVTRLPKQPPSFFFLFFCKKISIKRHVLIEFYKKVEEKYNGKSSEENRIRGKGIFKAIHAWIHSLHHVLKPFSYVKRLSSVHRVDGCRVFRHLRCRLFFANA